MKKKMHKDVLRIGTKTIDIEKLEHYEAVSMALVGILSISIGTLYGELLF